MLVNCVHCVRLCLQATKITLLPTSYYWNAVWDFIWTVGLASCLWLLWTVPYLVMASGHDLTFYAVVMNIVIFALTIRSLVLISLFPVHNGLQSRCGRAVIIHY